MTHMPGPWTAKLDRLLRAQRKMLPRPVINQAAWAELSRVIAINAKADGYTSAFEYMGRCRAKAVQS